jgi:hypothetical protein
MNSILPEHFSPHLSLYVIDWNNDAATNIVVESGASVTDKYDHRRDKFAHGHFGSPRSNGIKSAPLDA